MEAKAALDRGTDSNFGVERMGVEHECLGFFANGETQGTQGITVLRVTGFCSNV